eukprot:12167_3
MRMTARAFFMASGRSSACFIRKAASPTVVSSPSFSWSFSVVASHPSSSSQLCAAPSFSLKLSLHSLLVTAINSSLPSSFSRVTMDSRALKAAARSRIFFSRASYPSSSFLISLNCATVMGLGSGVSDSMVRATRWIRFSSFILHTRLGSSFFSFASLTLSLSASPALSLSSSTFSAVAFFSAVSGSSAASTAAAAGTSLSSPAAVSLASVPLASVAFFFSGLTVSHTSTWTVSSMAASALSTSTSPERVSRNDTFILGLVPFGYLSMAFLTPVMLYLAIVPGTVAGTSPSYLTVKVRSSSRLKVKRRFAGILCPTLKSLTFFLAVSASAPSLSLGSSPSSLSSSTAPPSESMSMDTGKEVMSCTPNLRRRKAVESEAASAAPKQKASSAFIVFCSCDLPLTSKIFSPTLGIRQPPPTTSTLISSAVRLACFNAASMGPDTRPKRSWTSFSKSARVIVPLKSSPMKLSIEGCASLLADSVVLVFS